GYSNDEKIPQKNRFEFDKIVQFL
ncbi:NAD(P)H-dependent oxidoreductase, partial [Campylobacter coli]|nr:NAD(P)H-dependent oxidoreductase [Campylobacter coli]EAL9771344.1 NAD(P)H-dependent oxidoreductase [Campylobacter coli]